MATTIPKQLYVTIQYRKDASEGLLGFASPYTKDASFEKRKATQDQWAYGYNAKFTIDNDGEISGEFSENTNLRGTQFDALMLLAAGCYPRILTNDLQEGFEISKNVRRSGGWSGSGNVVWRIADPRGFELEISSENFAKILDCTTIINGVIQGKCTWGRDGSKNILLPEASAPYQEATALTELIDANVTVKDIAPGDTIELLNSNITKGSYIYMGMFKVYATASEPNPDSDSESNRYGKTMPGVALLMGKGVSRHIFKNVNDGSYSTTSTPKIKKILARTTAPLEPKETAYEIMRTCNGYIDNVDNIVTLVIDSKETFSKDKLSYKLVDADYVFNGATGEEFPKLGKYKTHCMLLFTEQNGVMYMSSHSSQWQGGGYRYTPQLKELVSDKLLDGEIRQVGKFESTGSSYWNRQTYFVVRTIEPAVGMKFKQLVLEYNGVDYPITQIGYMG